MRLSSLLLVLLACSDEPEPPGEAFADERWPEALNERGLVVEWHASDAWGFERFEVRRDGSSAYEIDPVRGPHVEVERALTAGDLQALRDRLVVHECCELPSEDGPTIAFAHSEGLLRVRLPGLSCDVHQRLRGWDEDDARRCDDAIRQLHGRIRPPGSDSAAQAPAEEEPADEEQPDEPIGDVPPG